MNIRCIARLLLAGLASLVLPAMAQHHHDAHPAWDATHAAVPAQRYASDSALREGMSHIRAALDELAHYEMGHMPKSIAIERVDAIHAATESIFANCKLPADADSALHGMLVPLLKGIQAFRDNPDDTSTIATLRQALADYPRVFDDPGWPLPVAAATDNLH
jgi:hypothetical protein